MELTVAEKARNMAYRKPLVKQLNYDDILSSLYEMQESCASVSYFDVNEEEFLMDALDGNEDEAYQFKMMFSDLESDIDRTIDDVTEFREYIPDCFDDWFIACHAGRNNGYMGYDEYEEDFVSLDYPEIVESDAEKRISRMKKDDIIQSGRICFLWFVAYMSIKDRYDKLKATFDILKGKNVELTNTVKRLNELYDIVADHYADNYKSEVEFDCLIYSLPQEIWLQ